MDFALAVDIGGTKVAAGMVDECGRLHDRRSVPTPEGVEADEVFEAVAEAVEAFGPYDRVVVCGVGCAGPILH